MNDQTPQEASGDEAAKDPSPDEPKDIRQQEEPPPPIPDDEDDTVPVTARLPREDEERRLREENLNRLQTTQSAYNSVFFQTAGGDVFIGDQGQRVQIEVYDEESLRERRRACVLTSSMEQLSRHLDHTSLLGLDGDPGTGRMFAAVHALSLWAAQGGPLNRKVAWLRASDLGRLTADDLPYHHGFVLDAGDMLHRSKVDDLCRGLQKAVEARQARLVVLTTGPSPAELRTVRHDPPDHVKVFSVHADTAIRRKGLPRLSLPDELYAWGRDATSPAMSALRAQIAVDGIATGETPEQIKATQPDPLRGVVQDMLSSATPMHRCFLISAAVLTDVPIVIVSRAANALAEHLGIEPGRPGANGEAADWEWLREWVKGVDYTIEGTSRRLRLSRPEMAAVVLEEVWEEGQSIREGVLAWLDTLTRHAQREIKMKAAHAIGKLASYDYTLISAEFFRPWTSGQPGRSRRWLAPWALEAAALDERSVVRVRRQLRDWSGASAEKRLAAAQAYGSHIGRSDPEEALQSLQRILLRSAAGQTQIHDAVSRALTEVYGPASGVLVIDELVKWVETGHPGLRRTMALTLTRLTAMRGTNRPRLDLGAFTAEEWTGAEPKIVQLWLDALACGVFSSIKHSINRPVHEVWTSLAQWIGRWDDDPRVRRVLSEIFSACPPDLRSPLAFHLRQWSHTRALSPRISRHLHGFMKGHTR
ncbi:hypothetical protein [Herbidospora yilanensis]|uniref:hypothetical protein n=1 Tax=Herbidospora yilanensis TaxID=354426 RepID=UPI000782A1C6|nr:hypothetical protein [Herbidospora yilanensis]